MLCLLLYADASIVMANTRVDLQDTLDYVYDYCQRWRLYVNARYVESVSLTCVKTRNKEFDMATLQVVSSKMSRLLLIISR